VTPSPANSRSARRRFVPPEPVRRVLVNFNRLSWRLGLAITSVVLLTTVVVFLYAVQLVLFDVEGFLDSLEASYVEDLFRRYDAYSNRHLTLENLGWLELLPYFLPLLIPLAIGLVVAVLVARFAARPLERIATVANAVASGNLEARVPLSAQQQRSDDEMNRLVVHFNAMASSLQHLETERRETTAAIAHELRTPLMVLQGRLEGVRDNVIPLTQREATQLLTQVQTLTRLVDDLRTLSLSDAGKLELRLQPLDLLDVLSLSVAAFSHRAEARGIALELTADEAILSVRGDPDRLSQVFGNLLENALRHTPEGGRIALNATREGQCVRVEVRDSGSGIPATALPHLFERFYRADTSRSRDSGGSGLGLAIARAILEAHGGGIAAENLETGGALFAVTLPWSLEA
jgi:two-component system, OmpR family, sensor histidine kinase BaeS